MAYVQGEDRYQIIMFPDSIDDYVAEDNPVRVIDAFVQSLDVAACRWQMIVEHPFGTIKRNWGYNHFLTRGLESGKTETCLMFLAYNLKRVINILGVKEILKRGVKEILKRLQPA